MSEFLVDETVNGKDRKWGVKKSNSWKYRDRLFGLADRYEYHGDEFETQKLRNKGIIVADCGNRLIFKLDVSGNKKLSYAQFCRDRFCPLCNWRKTLRNSYEMINTLTHSLIKNPKSKFLFLTLTVKNVEGKDLRKIVKMMNKALTQKMLKRKKITKNLIGFVKNVEVTVNRETMEFHPHIHLLFQVKSTYFKKGEYINQEMWQKFWKEAMKLDYDPMVNIQIIKSRNGYGSLHSSVNEISKYSTKSTNYLSLNDEQDMDILDVLRIELKGLRMLSYGGILKKIHKSLFLKNEDDSSNDELINANGNENSDMEDEAKTITAFWNSKYHNYVIAETDEKVNLGKIGGC
ncbi:hypothetical protein DKP74_07115 [Fructilactobacillus sanfranciscensis]|uniref:protein rep n=1 Tax=Fructilactobacillus sanfranciscensis TaxID=1625 RepID=UPI00111AADE5|nr:protein rep [Fructilactobacillus sanfranciscensis]TNK94907.1 hypothetical protein DKP74_07115 [Fructilactobacillus sanfranciscensis]